MVLVYWEQQGADLLCGVHCLNTLLQGPVYSAGELAAIAGQLDKEEASLLGFAPGVSVPSQNVDASGNFSIGVLERGLQRAHAGVQIINLQRSDVKEAVLKGPEAEAGYICNLHEHWYTIRRVGGKWYNLNSVRQGAPSEISEFHLASFLLSVSQTGWTIFVIRGPPLPDPIRRPLVAGNQFYLDDTQMAAKHREYEDNEKRQMAEAQRIAGGEGNFGGEESSGPAFTVIAPSSAKRPEKTDWGKLGTGHSLSGKDGGASGDIAALAADDPELAAALAASMQDLVSTLPEPSPEPAAGEGLSLQVRLPSGKRLARRFAWEQALLDVCTWLEYTVAADSDGLLGCSSLVDRYQLVMQTFPPSERKKFKRIFGRNVVCDSTDVTTATLLDLGFQKQETLILQM